MTGTKVVATEDYAVISLRAEYPGYEGREKYAVFSDLGKEELERKYKAELEPYAPYVLLTEAEGEAFSDFNRNENKFHTRQHDNIVPKELYERAQKRSRDISEGRISYCDHKSNYYGPAENYLKEKIFCGKCGSSCVFRHQTTWAGFRCADKVHVRPRGCNGLSIPLGTVNKAILDVLEVESGIRRERVCKSLIDRNISRVVVHEGGIVYVEVKKRRGDRYGQKEQKE